MLIRYYYILRNVLSISEKYSNVYGQIGHALIVIYAGVCVHDGEGVILTIFFTLYIFDTFLKTFFFYVWETAKAVQEVQI